MNDSTDLRHVPSEASERLALARRLHDGPAQRLVALGYELDGLIGDSSLAPHIRSQIRVIRLEISAISTSFRDEIYLLRHIPFEKLSGSLRTILPTAKLEISLPLSVFNSEAEDKISGTILEIARNTARHASANEFSISYQISDVIEIVIATDSSSRIELKERSFGLKLIAEVISQMGGEISWSSDSTGSIFRINLPKP